VLRSDPSSTPDELHGQVGVPDPTEDLANEVTTELTNSRLLARAQAQRVIVNDRGWLDLEAADTASVATNCTVLRDRYVLEQQLGDGGNAVIFRAVDLRRDSTVAEGRRVAIKLLRPELRNRPHSVARLQREFRQTQALTHPNVVRFHDLDCDGETWFIVMELLTGEALGPRLRRAAPAGLPWEETTRIAAATAEALAFAHDQGVTHGDIKPDNIFVTAAGAVRVLDFGVAPESAPQSQLDKHGIPDAVVAAATRAYASPEVLEGQDPEPRDDVFSLACVIYEMLAGRHPYGRRGADAARDARTGIEPLASLSPPQWAALAAGLAWNRRDRPGVRELMRALTAAPIVPTEPHRRSSGAWWLVAAIGLAFLLGVVISRFGREAPQSGSRGAPPANVATGGDAEVSRVSDEAPPVAVAVAVADIDSAEFQAEEPLAAEFEEPPPLPPGMVAFDAASMAVSERAVVAAIPVRHFDRAGRSVEVGWRAIDGTAAAGRDYGGPQVGLAKFAEGHAFRIIYVPIVSDMRTAGDRTFTVELTGASGGAMLGMYSSIAVTILDDA